VGEWFIVVRSNFGVPNLHECRIALMLLTYYQGEFVNGKPEGQGLLVYTSGKMLSGNWKGGSM